MRSSLLVVSALVCVSMAAATAEIHDAAKAGDRVRIQALVEKDPQSVNARDETGRAPLHWACREGNNEIVELLISRGAEVRIADDTGATPLHAASGLDDAAAMRLLMDRGADPNARDLQGKTPLNVAATNGGEAAVRLLIERKAKLENRDDWGRTPLITAAREKGGGAVIRALLDAGANINAVDGGGDSALQLAAWRGYADVVNLLLERGAEVPVTGQAGATLLNFGVSRALDRLFLVMVQKGADLNTEAEGSALLRAGAAGGSVPILKVLIEKGQNVNDADENGWSPLHYAVDLGRTEAMDFLLDHGADANARTLMGQSAFNIADENGDKEIAALLAARGADKSPPRFPVLRGPYMGQKEPGKTPGLFAGGIVSARYHLHSSVAFSPDGKEAMWSVLIPGRGSGYGSGRTLVSRLDDGRWTYPQRAAYGGAELDDVPTYSPDGKKLYDMASRTLPGGPETGKENIWVWGRSKETWAQPKPLEGLLNDVPLHWQFGVDQLENIYISTNIASGRGRGDLFVSRCVEGRYQRPENLGDGVNTASDEGTPFVSPDGRTLLFHRDGDLYASFLGKDGKWGASARLGGGVNTPGYELCPTLSPDGKCLFFLRGYAVYWVNAGVIEDARAVQLARAGRKSAAAEIEQILRQGDVETARARFGAMTGTEAGAHFVDEPELITLGYRFLGERKVAEATAVFEMNARAFPGSWNAWDSLAEAFLHSQDREKAEVYYAKSVALNPENQNGKDMLSELRGYKLDAAGETRTPSRFPPGAGTGLKGPYLGQAPPGLKPAIFAPGIVSTSGNFEFTITFSPDGRELYFTRREGKGRNTIMRSRLVEAGWTAPEEAAFAKGFPSNEPSITPDGRKLYFGSRRPRPGVEGAEYGIWAVERAEGGDWGEPRYHGPGMYVSVARTGNLYMTDVTNVIRRGAIVYPLADGRCGPPRWLGGGVNAPKVADHIFVAPDEGLILLDSPNRPGGQGGDGDLWVCFRKPDGAWSDAQNLGDGVNGAATQFCPTLSPDGKYIFYATNRDIFWVSAKVLDPLRERALGPSPTGGTATAKGGGTIPPVVDGHNHEALSVAGGAFDTSKVADLQARGFGVVIVGLPVDRQRPADAEARVREEIARLRGIAANTPGFSLADDPAALLAGVQPGILHLFFSIEWPYGIFGGDPSSVRRYLDLGVRVIGLSEKDGDGLFGRGDLSATLSPLGTQIVAAMNEAGVLIDVTHLSHAQKLAVISRSRAPVVASHSLVQAVTPVGFNLPDEVVAALAASGGSVWVSFNRSDLLGGAPDDEALERLVKNIEVLVGRLGKDRVGIGTDLQAGGRYTPTPLNQDNAFALIGSRLLERGFSQPAIEGILGRNVLRAMADGASACGSASAAGGSSSPIPISRKTVEQKGGGS